MIAVESGVSCGGLHAISNEEYRPAGAGIEHVGSRLWAPGFRVLALGPSLPESKAEGQEPELC